MIQTKDYKHLEGRKIIMTFTHKGTVIYVLVEAALVEYSMGITLKPTSASNSNAMNAFCINGKDSPNQRAYLRWIDTYDSDFTEIIRCLETYSIFDLDRVEDAEMGSTVCATGMSV